MKTFSHEIMNCFSYPRILPSEVGMKHSVYVPLTKKIFGLNPGEEELKIKVVTKTEYLYEYNDKDDTINIASQKAASGMSPLQINARNLNYFKSFTMGTIVTLSTGGLSAGYQATAGVVGGVVDAYGLPKFSPEQLSKRLYLKTERLK